MKMPTKVVRTRKTKKRNPYALPAKQRKAGSHKSNKRRVEEKELDKEIEDNG